MQGDEEQAQVVKHARGWNRRGFRWDKTSDRYKEYRQRLFKTKTLNARKRLESLAKAPLPGRVYKSKPKSK